MILRAKNGGRICYRTNCVNKLIIQIAEEYITTKGQKRFRRFDAKNGDIELIQEEKDK